MTSEAGRRSSVDNDVYDGPVIAARSRGVDAGWVWVANGTRPATDLFSVPGPVTTSPRSEVPPLRVDEATADAFVDALRVRAWEDGEDEVWAEEDLDDGFIDQTVTVRAAAPVLERAEVDVRVLGPVEVIGWTQAPDRAIVTELACYLSLHPGRIIPADELRAALWPETAREASAKSLRTYMSLLRKALGAANVPVASGAGYRIGEGVTTDWLRFRKLTGPGASPDELQDGLELVRGRPFTGVPSTSFGWVFSELLVSEIEAAVVDATRKLVEARSADGDVSGASWAARRGLLAVPTDFGLWELHLTLADRQGPDELGRARRDAEAALGDDAVDLVHPVTLDGSD